MTEKKDKKEKDIKKQDKNTIIEGNLHCNGCNISYPIKSSIPDLIPYDILIDDEWQMWKDHLEVSMNLGILGLEIFRIFCFLFFFCLNYDLLTL